MSRNLPMRLAPAQIVYADIRKTCRGCGKRHWWKGYEQEWFVANDYGPPELCPACRELKRYRSNPTYPLCVDCGEYPAHPDSFGPTCDWTCRCVDCWNWRFYPDVARRDYDSGIELPDAIYQHMIDHTTNPEPDEDVEYYEEEEVDTSDDYPADNQSDVQEPLDILQAEPGWMSELPSTVITSDIHRLVNDAFSALDDRKATVWEWIRGLDPRAEQLSRKLKSAGDAETLIRKRQDLVDHLTNLFNATTGLRRQQLEAFLEELHLKNQIVEQMTLSRARVRTLQLAEERQQRNLLALPEAHVPERDRLVQEHRDNLRAKSTARRGTLADFRAEVKEIMDSDLGDDEAAVEIRAVLDAYGMSEEALPKKVARFLTDVENGGGDV